MKSNYEIAKEVLSGKWGNGEDRKFRITAAGYDYHAVQSIVNSLLNDNYTPVPDDPQQHIEYLSIDFDTRKYQGIEINLILGD